MTFFKDEVAEQMLWGIKEKRKDIFVSNFDRLVSRGEMFGGWIFDWCFLFLTIFIVIIDWTIFYLPGIKEILLQSNDTGKKQN